MPYGAEEINQSASGHIPFASFRLTGGVELPHSSTTHEVFDPLRAMVRGVRQLIPPILAMSLKTYSARPRELVLLQCLNHTTEVLLHRPRLISLLRRS